MSGPATTAIVVLTPEELAALIKAAVLEALSGHTGGPLLVDKQTLASKLYCSVAHIDKLRKLGLPVVYVGEAVRFEPPRVLEWLRGRTETDEGDS